MISSRTGILFSISSNTSNRGAEYYNSLFIKKNINLIYIPVSIKTNKNFDNFIKFLKEKNLNFFGSSISMPFKERILKYVDINDRSVKKTKNANTIVL